MARPPGALRRRRVRDGAIQAAYALTALAAAILLPKITAGPAVDAQRTAALLQAFAGGLLMFMALVFSLLFLVVQYASANLSPRLLLFRDQPLIWHALGLFLGAFVFAGTASLASARATRLSITVPAVAIVLVLAALFLARTVQLRAFAAVQLGTVTADITRRGLDTITGLYDGSSKGKHDAAKEQARIIGWPGRQYAVLQHADLAGLQRLTPPGTTVQVAMPGTVLQPGDPVFTFHGSPPAETDEQLLKLATIGDDRVFGQDPLLAFRLLSDIALRALSPAVNDPATAIQAIDGLETLLRNLSRRDLLVTVTQSSHPQVALTMPVWEQYVQASTEAIPFALAAPTARQRFRVMLENLLAITREHLHEPLAVARELLAPPQQ